LMSKRGAKKTRQGGGLGARYGVKARKRYSEVVSEMKRGGVCPQCSSNTVRRESVGIWVCTKCGFRFAGGAYVPSTKLGTIADRSARSA